MRTRVNTRRRGTFGENIAAEYLQKNGFRILERNYRFERGEIDLVAEDGNEIVFVEVKTRRTKKFGEPEEAVDEGKQDQIRNIAEGYVLERKIGERICRFDVVAVSVIAGRTEINHIRDAF